ncbi:MAG: protein-glutamate O-methyltransferase CheR [Pirellula sp.]
MQLTPTNIGYIFDYIEQLCGIALDDSKGYLIEARLNPLLKQHAVQSPVELIDKAKSPAGESIRQSLVEAMTTRETFFFRDNSPFEALQFKALPELLDAKLREKSTRVRIWSAAASTGQEACSIGIILHEMIPDLHRWDIQILATDISENALARGRSGVYTKLEIDRGLPKQYISKYFAPTKDGYKVLDSVHRLIRFQHLNLLEPFPFQVQFDVIFCRNVAIYFDKKVKVDLFRRMLPLLPTYGYLFVGVSEALFDCGPEFKPQYHCKSTFYQPNSNYSGLASPASTSTAPAMDRPSTSSINRSANQAGQSPRPGMSGPETGVSVASVRPVIAQTSSNVASKPSR